MISSQQFIIRLLIFSGIVWLLIYLLSPYFPPSMAFQNRESLQLILIAATYIVHMGMVNAAKKGNAHFIRFFMGATAVKMGIFLVILIGYGIMNRENAFSFILNFFIYYLLYTVFEVAIAYKAFAKAPARNQ